MRIKIRIRRIRQIHRIRWIRQIHRIRVLKIALRNPDASDIVIFVTIVGSFHHCSIAAKGYILDYSNFINLQSCKSNTCKSLKYYMLSKLDTQKQLN